MERKEKPQPDDAEPGSDRMVDEDIKMKRQLAAWDIARCDCTWRRETIFKCWCTGFSFFFLSFSLRHFVFSPRGCLYILYFFMILFHVYFSFFFRGGGLFCRNTCYYSIRERTHDKEKMMASIIFDDCRRSLVFCLFVFYDSANKRSFNLSDKRCALLHSAHKREMIPSRPSPLSL